ncbi:AraC family transcriptional regulator [Achromobacter xylosoxidans]|uniref:AraC family transcriptional regulator n=1 Tax=Alcaligenes xylosoxydans xylosoxydans TaxID=85698 RepID=UPI001F13CF28|nr:AraC family transcriptional regulator [Achromobacter xylosoxidans]
MKDEVRYQAVPGTPGLVLGVARLVEFQFDRHYHVDYHIGLVTQGVQRQTVRGRSILLGPGALALMPPGEIHDGSGVDAHGHAYTLKTFRMAPDLMRGFIAEVSGAAPDEHFLGTLIEDAGLAARFMGLHASWMAGAAAGALAHESASLALMAALFARTGTVAPQEVRGGLSMAHTRTVLDYCQAHLGDKIGLEDLARLCGLSRYQFLRRFALSVGLTPHAWLTRLRLERACATLARAPASIAQVAAEVGFYDQSHFNRAFRSAYGVPPSAYRRVA